MPRVRLLQIEALKQLGEFVIYRVGQIVVRGLEGHVELLKTLSDGCVKPLKLGHGNRIRNSSGFFFLGRGASCGASTCSNYRTGVGLREARCFGRIRRFGFGSHFLARGHHNSTVCVGSEVWSGRDWIESVAIS